MLNRRRRPDLFLIQPPSFAYYPLAALPRSYVHKDTPYRRFVIYNQDAAAILAAARELTSNDRRVLDIAISRMNDFGHANFGRGELLRELGVSRTTVYRAKRKLHKAGLLSEATGGETCIWVSHMVAKRGKSGRKCRFHG